MPTSNEADQFLESVAQEVAEKINTNILSKTDEPMNALMTIMLAQFIETMSHEIKSKHFPTEYSKQDFRLAAARAMRKIADEIHGKH